MVGWETWSRFPVMQVERLHFKQAITFIPGVKGINVHCDSIL
jgi:hypothetical protein